MTETTRPRPRPVFDPGIPAAERALLRGPAAHLVAASLPRPVKPQISAARMTGRAIWIPMFAFFYGVLPGGWITLFFLASLDEDDLMSSVFRWGKFAVLAMMATPALQIMLILLGAPEVAAVLAAVSFTGWTIGAIQHVGEAHADRAIREHHGRYLVLSDFDKPAARLLLRAQQAIDTVLGSEAQRAGLLDDVDNWVTLAQQEWEIAEALAEHTRLRRERRIQQPARLSEPVRALLEPQRRALNLSVQSITERIEALETYARRTNDTDSAYHEWQVLQRLPEQNARYRELLARTVRDGLAHEEIRRLTADAERAEAILRDTITSAQAAAQALILPGATPAPDVRPGAGTGGDR